MCFCPAVSALPPDDDVRKVDAFLSDGARMHLFIFVTRVALSRSPSTLYLILPTRLHLSPFPVPASALFSSRAKSSPPCHFSLGKLFAAPMT